ncbi:uncharacterized protein LOC141759581 [Sebastes fasciatus]|uniref:uncharacterized protein LOC141759581 n=1 Tax=Sebastes fasciatus TaxID=394691 RepID=UPI003D9EC96A
MLPHHQLGSSSIPSLLPPMNLQVRVLPVWLFGLMTSRALECAPFLDAGSKEKSFPALKRSVILYSVAWRVASLHHRERPQHKKHMTQQDNIITWINISSLLHQLYSQASINKSLVPLLTVGRRSQRGASVYCGRHAAEARDTSLCGKHSPPSRMDQRTICARSNPSVIDCKCPARSQSTVSIFGDDRLLLWVVHQIQCSPLAFTPQGRSHKHLQYG